MNTGIKVKKYIESDNKNILVIKEKVNFDKNNIDEYIFKLNELIDDGILEDCKFNDNIWTGINEFGEKYSLRFNFEIYTEINIALKCYTILKLYDQYTSLNNAYKGLNYISNILLKTNLFNEEYVETFILDVKNWTITQHRDIGFLKQFLAFYTLDISNNYIRILNSIKNVRSNSRTLPSYYSIITFDYLIQNFISNNYLKNYKKYTPIIIWWELTKIIPMRPIEFAILKRDCLFEKSNRYFIKIERRKEKGGKVKYKTVKVLTEIEIPINLYKIIENHINTTPSETKDNFIFSYEMYKEFEGLSSRGEKKIDFITMANMRKLLNDFFEKVVQNLYGYKILPKGDVEEELQDYQIEKIQLGDTRHIAFCGMMLQGFSSLTIAEIGGHYTLSQQCSYTQHLDKFVDAHTFVLTKAIRNKMIKNVVDSIHTTPQIPKDKIILKNMLGAKYYTYPKVKGGRCTSGKFPFECESDKHIFCKYFIPDETLSSELLNNELIIVNSEITNKTTYIKTVMQTLYGVGKAPNIDAELKTNSKTLNTLMRKKALLQSYKLDITEDSKNE